MLLVVVLKMTATECFPKGISLFCTTNYELITFLLINTSGMLVPLQVVLAAVVLVKLFIFEVAIV